MRSFKSALFLPLIGLVLSGCSMQVEDKNEGLDNEEKKGLILQESDKSLEIKDVKLESTVALKDGTSAKSNINGKYYTLKVCLKDSRRTKELASIPVRVDGEKNKIDTSGCIRWSHEIKIDYTKGNNCRIFEKDIQISKNRKKTFKYAIDYITNEIVDLEKSKGCTAQFDHLGQKALQSEEVISLGDVKLTYKTQLSDRRSDDRYVKFATSVKACIEINKTGKALRNANLRLKATNMETGEVSYDVSKNLVTNNGGCFNTEFHSQYELYMYSHWMPINLEIEVLSGPLEGTIKNRVVYINPWEPSRQVFGYGDLGIMPPKRKFKNKYAKFHLDGVMYIQIGNNTKEMVVDDYLGLTVSKSYQVVLNPYIDREHRWTKGEVPITRLSSKGKFKLSMIVLSPREGDIRIGYKNFEDFEYVTGAQKIVEVNNGVINTIMNINFPLHALPKLAVRTMTILKIEPATNTNLRPSIVSGVFKARIPWIKTNVLQEEALNLPNTSLKLWKDAFGNVEAGQRAPKTDFQAEDIDKFCSSQNKTTSSNCVSELAEIINSDFDQRHYDYNKFIESMFAKLQIQTDEYGKAKKLLISPKTIYENHLRKSIPGVEILSFSEASEKLDINFTSRDYDKLMPEGKLLHGLTKNMVKELCREGAYTMEGRAKEELDIIYKRCLKEPTLYFNTKSVRHVSKVDELGDVYTNGLSLHAGERKGVQSAVQDYRTQNISDYLGFDTGNKIDIPYLSDMKKIGKYIPNLGFKSGRTWQSNTGNTRSDGYNYSENVGTDKSFSLEKFVVDVYAEFERCVLIVPEKFVDASLRKERLEGDLTHHGTWAPNNSKLDFTSEYFYPKTSFKKTRYICDDDTKREMYRESWYFMQARTEANYIARDIDSPVERKLLRVFRSEKNFVELRKAIYDVAETNLKMDNIALDTPEDILIEHWGHLLRGTGLRKRDAAKYLVEHVEGTFPGTIEGNQATKFKEVR